MSTTPSTSKYLLTFLTKPKSLHGKIQKILNTVKMSLYSLNSSREQGQDLEWRKSVIGSVEANHKFKDKEYKCRFLTEFSINILKPADCFNHVVQVAKNSNHEHLPKRVMMLHQDDIRMILLKNSSLTESQNREKLRKSSKTQDDDDDDDTDELEFSRIKSKKTRKAAASSPQTVFRPSSFKGSLIPISKIAFCCTVPSRPDILLLIWRSEGNLICRAYIFSSILKAHKVKHQIAMRFERAFRAWQMQFCRRSFTKKSFKGRKKPSRNYKSKCTHRILRVQSSSPF